MKFWMFLLIAVYFPVSWFFCEQLCQSFVEQHKNTIGIVCLTLFGSFALIFVKAVSCTCDQDIFEGISASSPVVFFFGWLLQDSLASCWCVCCACGGGKVCCCYHCQNWYFRISVMMGCEDDGVTPSSDVNSPRYVWKFVKLHMMKGVGTGWRWKVCVIVSWLRHVVVCLVVFRVYVLCFREKKVRRICVFW